MRFPPSFRGLLFVDVLSMANLEDDHDHPIVEDFVNDSIPPPHGCGIRRRSLAAFGRRGVEVCQLGRESLRPCGSGRVLRFV